VSLSIQEFQDVILHNYREQGRKFPWRERREPWGVLVSELMLQQTQTDRVISYWERWMSLWPSPAQLAAADFEQVLREWSGLGYNRRARFIQQSAKTIMQEFNGTVPQSIEELERLPGVGPYTARAVACFAYNQATAFLETNIRAVYLHFFFQGSDKVHDKDLMPLVEESLYKADPAQWYYALMDYGAKLKKLTVNPSRRSKHHTTQSPFEGSVRQARGYILRKLSDGPQKVESIVADSGIENERMAKALLALVSEGFVRETDGQYSINNEQ
jgi:A/G-specific adenine glycosylase